MTTDLQRAAREYRDGLRHAAEIYSGDLSLRLAHEGYEYAGQALKAAGFLLRSSISRELARGTSQADVARELGWSRQRLHEFMKEGKK